MSRQEETSEEPKRRPRRLGRKLLVALGLLIAGLVWLNGPGWRWLGGIALRRALDKADMAADFELRGTLLGGVRVEELTLSGGVIRKLEIGSAGPLYKVSRVIRGEIEGVAVRRIDAVIDLAAAPPRLAAAARSASMPAPCAAFSPRRSSAGRPCSATDLPRRGRGPSKWRRAPLLTTRASV